MPTVAITGATGFLGSVLVDYFLQKNWKVIALSRKPGQKKHIHLAYRDYDLSSPVDDTLLNDIDYIVHAAYVKAADNASALDVNVTGAENLISAIKKSNVKQVIFISSMSAHPGAISIYGKQKLYTERLFSKLENSTIIRPGLIVGNGGIVKEMSTIMATKHVVPIIDGGGQPLQIISVFDLATAIYNIFQRSLYGRYVVATTKVYKYKDFYKALAKQIHVNVIYVPIPYTVLLGIFKIVSLLPIKLGVGEDNLKGLKKLVSMQSASDLRKIGIIPDDLTTALAKLTVL